jgi:hypothetical protein
MGFEPEQKILRLDRLTEDVAIRRRIRFRRDTSVNLQQIPMIDLENDSRPVSGVSPSQTQLDLIFQRLNLYS